MPNVDRFVELQLYYARRAILNRYCRKHGGRIRFCGTSRPERVHGRELYAGSNGKPIFDDRQSAEDAARELEAIGTPPQRSYPCPRSRHGHHHLTTDWPAVRARERRLEQHVKSVYWE